jgi:phosphopantothenoylcysteine decarboxylase/phosphopantothenate--cysteine ligase
VPVETAREMRDAVAGALVDADVLVMAAAVADFRPARPAAQKVKKRDGTVAELPLEATDDILLVTREQRPPGCLVVGFALETETAVANAREKLEKKDLDFIVVNDATESGAGFEVDTNRVVILARSGEASDLPLLTKYEVADEIMDRVGNTLSARA